MKLSGLFCLVAMLPLFCGAICVPTAAPPPSVTTEDKFISNYCELLERCVDRWGRTFYDEAACKDYFKGMADCGTEYQFGYSSFTMKLSYNESQGNKCIEWMQRASCSDNLGDNADCQKVFRAKGAVAEGEVCENDVDTIRVCDNGLYCERDQSEGVCEVCRAKGVDGEACSDGVPCDDNHYCQEQVCRTLLADNASCQENSHCKSGYCTGGVCSDPLERGETCDADDVCRGSLRCHNGRCNDRGDEGDSCSRNQDCQMPGVCQDQRCEPFEICAIGEVGEACWDRCVDGAFCGDAECQNYLALGASCDSSVQCGFPQAYCNSDSQCATYASLGSACGSEQPCVPFESFCDYGADPQNPVCASSKSLGETCNSPLQCESFYCDDQSSQCAIESQACQMP